MMVSDDGINTPASFDTTPSKSVRPTKKQQQQQHNPPPSLPLSSFAIGPIDPHSRCTPHEREGPHPKRFVFPGPLTHPKEGRKDIKKKRKKKETKLRVKRETSFALSRAPGHARVRDGLSERRNRRLRSGVSRNGKHRLLSRVCVFVTFCCCSSKGARFS